VTGPIKELSDDGSLVLGGSAPTRAKGADIVSLRRAHKWLPGYPKQEYVLLTNGDAIPGSIVELANDRLLLRAALGTAQELSLPLSSVAVIGLDQPPGLDRGELETRRRQLLSEQRTRDRIRLRNGDVIEGTLTSIDRQTPGKAGSVHIETEKKDVTIERDQVAVIALNTELARSLRPKGPYSRLVLANGCRLVLRSAGSDGKTLVGTTPFGATIKVPLEQVVALDTFQGPAVYLSDLKCRAYEYRPWTEGGVRWPCVRDGSVAGRDLRLAGSTYDKGLGLHSYSSVTYDLGGTYRRFEALVGIDDETGRPRDGSPGGSVRIKVLVDGKEQPLGWDRELTWRDGPQPVRMPVTGARELTLIVDFGRGGDVQDHVNWADARLIR
jgi:hypothetical protein